MEKPGVRIPDTHQVFIAAIPFAPDGCIVALAIRTQLQVAFIGVPFTIPIVVYVEIPAVRLPESNFIPAIAVPIAGQGDVTDFAQWTRFNIFFCGIPFTVPAGIKVKTLVCRAPDPYFILPIAIPIPCNGYIFKIEA